MRKYLFRDLLLLLVLIFALGNQSQCQIIYGGSPSQDSLWAIDTTNWAVVQRFKATLSGSTITGLNSIAYDPIEHEAYCLLKTSALPNATYLAQINLNTGVCTNVGSLGAQFSSITFRGDGQLMGVVGDGGGIDAEKLFLINKSNATKTFAANLGNGDNGEIICYNQNDGMIYHWSGSSSMVFEKFPAMAPHTPISNISTSGSSGGEAFGAIYLGNSDFIVSDANSNLRHLSNAGQYGNSLFIAPADLSGLVMPPRFTLPDNFICVNEPLTWNLKGIATDTAVYDWGDGTISKVFPAASASHIYVADGNYQCTAGLKNNVSGHEILSSVAVLVNPLPGVFLVPSSDTVICLEDTLVIAATFGGTSRWFRNGILIPGASANVYAATLSGWYNMAKTNLNGCTDSAAQGISVVFANHPPAPSILFDTSNCPLVLFQCNDPFGTAWNWDFGDGSTGTGNYPTHTYAAIGTYTTTVVATNACHDSTVSVTILIDCFIGIGYDLRSALSIAPNPSAGKFVLRADLPWPSGFHYRLIDLRGRTLSDHNDYEARSNWAQEITIEDAGIYFLWVEAGGESAVLRVVVE